MQKFSIKKGDTAPALKIQVKQDPGTGVEQPLDLTGASAVATMYDKDGVKKIDEKAATIYDEPNGRIQYQWLTGDTGTADLYHFVFKITLADSRILTVPNDRDDDLLVEVLNFG